MAHALHKPVQQRRARAREATMISIFESIYDYQRLRQREETLEIPLEPAERAELESLGRALARSLPSALSEGTVAAQFTVPGAFASGEVRSLSVNGLALVTARPCPRGTRTVVRIADPRRGAEYVFPGRVVWANDRVLGVAFDGMPSKTELRVPSGVWRAADVHLGLKRARPISA